MKFVQMKGLGLFRGEIIEKIHCNVFIDYNCFSSGEQCGLKASCLHYVYNKLFNMIKNYKNFLPVSCVNTMKNWVVFSTSKFTTITTQFEVQARSQLHGWNTANMALKNPQNVINQSRQDFQDQFVEQWSMIKHRQLYKVSGLRTSFRCS